ncbi:MAG: biotin/lipoyl-binding protein [Planctomycetota bacterium]
MSISGSPAERPSERPVTSDSTTRSLNALGNDAVWVAELAAESEDQGRFLMLLAETVLQKLDADIVAVACDDWDRPRMLVRDSQDTEKSRRSVTIDRDSIRAALAAAHRRADIVQLGDRGPESSRSTRAITVSWSCAALLVVPRDDASRADQDSVETLRSRLDVIALTASRGGNPPEATSVITTRQRDLSDDDASRVAAARRQLRSFHRDLDLTSTAFRIAAETSRLLPCDRASVFQRQRRSRRRPSYRVLSISGVSVIDRRSPMVRSMQTLTSVVAVTRRAWCHPGDDVPPQLEASLTRFLDETGATSVMLLPLWDHLSATNDAINNQDDALEFTIREFEQASKAGPPDGMLMLETFQRTPLSRVTPAIRDVAEEASLAFGNALRYDGVFALPLRRPLAVITRGIAGHWLLAFVVLFVVAALAAWFIQVDHVVVASGVARPESRRAVFAAIDGVVEQIHVDNGDRVAAGDVLITLRNEELVGEGDRIAVELAAATTRLASLRTSRNARLAEPTEVTQNLIEQQRLVSEIETLRSRAEVNRKLMNQSTIRAPIDGVIIGWRLQQRLRDRPIQRGDRICVMVDPSGNWELDLRIDERLAGDLLASAEGPSNHKVRFLLASRPESTYQATTKYVGQLARRVADGRNLVDVVALVDDPKSVFGSSDGSYLIRTDEDVTARIRCGRRRWLLSVTDDLVSWFHRHIAFHFR